MAQTTGIVRAGLVINKVLISSNKLATYVNRDTSKNAGDMKKYSSEMHF
ncbi:MAG: hypothetical protein VKN72_27745 [Nostocales cyanobacterium 94392]|nr:hypothetical protein [Nostocales cyanobacterium 94392]